MSIQIRSPNNNRTTFVRRFYKYMKYISIVDQDISQVSRANKGDILFNIRNNFIFPHIHVFWLLYKTIVLLPHKNRAVYAYVYTLMDTNPIGGLFNRCLVLIWYFIHADVCTNLKMSRPRTFELRLLNRSCTNINSQLQFNPALEFING